MRTTVTEHVPPPATARFEVFRCNPLADPRWADLVARSHAGSAFHDPAWLRLLSGHYGYAMTACCVAAPDGSLVAGLPVARVESRLTGRRLVALPFSDHCPPLVRAGASPDAARALANGLDALRRHHGMPLEIRGTGEVLSGAPAGERFLRHVVALGPDFAAVERAIARPQIRRGIRRAQREGLTTQVRTDEAGLALFYRLHVATRRRLGVPTQPRRFILRFAELFAAGKGFVLVVRAGGRPAAAAVFLTHRDVMTYKYGASDERLLAARPNNLLFSEAMRWGCDHGMRILDLGRTHPDHATLRRFKLAWGAEEEEIWYRHLGAGGGHDGRHRGERVLASVIRHGPPAASRVVGELLYRHAG